MQYRYQQKESKDFPILVCFGQTILMLGNLICKQLCFRVHIIVHSLLTGVKSSFHRKILFGYYQLMTMT
ncbi:hypothetical protein L1987_76611 [Smallanthus sonchifolius]|uniref:Uncharacterized protein n=1 Tax=Smallanthus sonchifolius TaxID=185202 RepID=A0ACB8Z799_9ASTR|nr:hypothetical protein L1987_76611 [Smallanthus sonchifolius]